MNLLKIGVTVLALGALAGCSVNDRGQYTTGKVAASEMSAEPTAAASVAILTEAPEEKYTELKELKVTVNKLTIFHRNPTREDALNELKAEAAKLGADAVINATVSEASIGLTSWGVRTATGMAIKYDS